MNPPSTTASTWLEPQRIRLAQPAGAFILDNAIALTRRIAAAWQRQALARRDAYLSRAHDLADLERRQSAWDDHEVQRANWPPLR